MQNIFLHLAVKVPKLSYFKVKISEAISQTKIFEKKLSLDEWLLEMDNSTDYYTNPPSSEQETCIDRDGREILDGFLYTPGWENQTNILNRC